VRHVLLTVNGEMLAAVDLGGFSNQGMNLLTIRDQLLPETRAIGEDT